MIGSFGGDKEEKQPDESLVDFYCRLRNGEIGTSTQGQYYTAWSRLQDFISDEHPEKSVFDLDMDEVRDWYDYLRDDDVSGDVQYNYASALAKMMDDLRRRNYISGDGAPFARAREKHSFNLGPERKNPEIGYQEMTDGVPRLKHPRSFSVILTFCKTGLRISELHNLDERDVHLDHPISGELDSPRDEIADKPNSIYVDSTIREGKEYNGELRDAGNKPDSTRTIPIDDETVSTLAWYCAGSDSSPSPANPLFRSTSGQKGGLGSRMGIPSIRYTVNDFCEVIDLDTSDGGSEKVTPHFFRHWYTTQMRSRIDEEEVPIGSVKEFVQGLRGDSEEGAIGTYTHEWTDGIEADVPPYPVIVRKNLPKFF